MEHMANAMVLRMLLGSLSSLKETVLVSEGQQNPEK